ncbi:MAG: hypothetical protein HYT79_04410 [Elusimicrobia bacterium]|nr:hypothetical protein [Elusimicrobiota bacterium]
MNSRYEQQEPVHLPVHQRPVKFVIPYLNFRRFAAKLVMMRYRVYYAGEVVGPMTPAEIMGQSWFNNSILVCPENTSGIDAADWHRAREIPDFRKPAENTNEGAAIPASESPKTELLVGRLNDLESWTQRIFDKQAELESQLKDRVQRFDELFDRLSNEWRETMTKLSSDAAAQSGQLEQLHSTLNRLEGRLSGFETALPPAVARIDLAFGAFQKEWAEYSEALRRRQEKIEAAMSAMQQPQAGVEASKESPEHAAAFQSAHESFRSLQEELHSELEKLRQAQDAYGARMTEMEGQVKVAAQTPAPDPQIEQRVKRFEESLRIQSDQLQKFQKVLSAQMKTVQGLEQKTAGAAQQVGSPIVQPEAAESGPLQRWLSNPKEWALAAGLVVLATGGVFWLYRSFLGAPQEHSQMATFEQPVPEAQATHSAHNLAEPPAAAVPESGPESLVPEEPKPIFEESKPVQAKAAIPKKKSKSAGRKNVAAAKNKKSEEAMNLPGFGPESGSSVDESNVSQETIPALEPEKPVPKEDESSFF